MRANKLETALSRDRLAACLAPPDMFFFMYISAGEVYCTRELMCCESTIASPLCLAKPKMSHKYILPVAFSLWGSIAASVQLKEGAPALGKP